MFNSYFSANYILDKKCLWNAVFSDRSDGKTFDCKARALLDYEKNRSITIYLRRFKSEITDKMYNSFFDEVLLIKEYERFKNWKFKGSKKGVLVKVDGAKEWDYIILFVPLTMAGKLKSQISEINRIKMIDYDEFIPLDNLYIKNEILLLLEFWKSIDRDREEVQLLILGNKITPFNPLFDYFGINLELTNDKIRTYRNNSIAIQIYSNKEHREKREQGRFRDLIKGTTYEDYDKGGILQALNLNIKSRDGFDYMCSFETIKGKGSIWYSKGEMVISEYIRQDGYLITDKIYSTSREQYLCTFGRFGILFKSVYRSGKMYFENDKSFYIFEPILTKIGGK